MVGIRNHDWLLVIFAHEAIRTISRMRPREMNQVTRDQTYFKDVVELGFKPGVV